LCQPIEGTSSLFEELSTKRVSLRNSLEMHVLFGSAQLAEESEQKEVHVLTQLSQIYFD